MLTISTCTLIQILSAEKSRKPQASHLLTRVEYLLKLIVVEAKTRKKKVRHRVVCSGQW